MRLIVLPGDGIGPEITRATQDVLRAASDRFGLGVVMEEYEVGHASLTKFGTTVRPELIEIAKQADGVMLGPTAGFDFKDESKGQINPSKHFRKTLDLFANIRPAQTYAGLPAKVEDFDLIVVRENTEGFYADRNMASGGGEILVTDDVAIAIRRITRLCCERIVDTACRLAMGRRKHVTLVHKANVLKISDGLFLSVAREVCARYPQLEVDEFIVDAMMAHVVRKPSRFDVIVTTNMFGDILSDLTSELSGSLGLAGSLNASNDYAMAQPAHGSAPDIAGKDIANPFSHILSTALLLAWHGERKQDARFVEAARAIEAAVGAAVSTGACTRDVGGSLGTADTGRALAKRIAG